MNRLKSRKKYLHGTHRSLSLEAPARCCCAHLRELAEVGVGRLERVRDGGNRTTTADPQFAPKSNIPYDMCGKDSRSAGATIKKNQQTEEPKNVKDRAPITLLVVRRCKGGVIIRRAHRFSKWKSLLAREAARFPRENIRQEHAGSWKFSSTFFLFDCSVWLIPLGAPACGRGHRFRICLAEPFLLVGCFSARQGFSLRILA